MTDRAVGLRREGSQEHRLDLVGDHHPASARRARVVEARVRPARPGHDLRYDRREGAHVVRRLRLPSAVDRVQHPRDAEVEQRDAAELTLAFLAEQDPIGGDATVDDAVLVRDGHRHGDRLQHRITVSIDSGSQAGPACLGLHHLS